MSDFSAALEYTLEPSAVHLYVCSLISRALARQELREESIKSETVALSFTRHRPSGISDAPSPEQEQRCAGEDIEEMLTPKRPGEEEPEDWIVFEGDENVVSEYRTHTHWGSPPACHKEQESGAWTPRVLQERVTNTVKEGVAKVGEVGGKLISTAGKVGDDATERLETAERYAKDIENIVKVKAAFISEKSRATYQDVENRLEELEGKSRMAYLKSSEDFESWLEKSGALDHMYRIKSAAVLVGGEVSSKAKAVSKAAKKVVRKKTGSLPTTGAVRRRFKSAFNNLQPERIGKSSA